jgi:hypothetical protein
MRTERIAVNRSDLFYESSTVPLTNSEYDEFSRLHRADAHLDVDLTRVD